MAHTYTASLAEVYQARVYFRQRNFVIVFIWKNDSVVLYGARSKRCCCDAAV
jgi:hypothetical protein